MIIEKLVAIAPGADSSAHAGGFGVTWLSSSSNEPQYARKCRCAIVMCPGNQLNINLPTTSSARLNACVARAQLYRVKSNVSIYSCIVFNCEAEILNSSRKSRSEAESLSMKRREKLLPVPMCAGNHLHRLSSQTSATREIVANIIAHAGMRAGTTLQADFVA